MLTVEAGAEISDLGSGQLQRMMTILGDNSLSSGGTFFRGPYLLGSKCGQDRCWVHLVMGSPREAGWMRQTGKGGVCFEYGT